METTNSRWLVLLVIGAVIVAAILFAILLPVIYYGGVVWDPPIDVAIPILNTNTPALTFTQSLAVATAQNGLITATATIDPNCTRTAIYWVYQLDKWPGQFILGDFSTGKDEVVTVIQTSTVDASILLLVEFVATYNNLVYGADPSRIEGIMSETSEWLSLHPPGAMLLESEAQQAMQLVMSLEEFNRGIVGPGQCADDPSAYTGLTSRIPVPALSITPSMLLLTNVVMSTPQDTSTVTPTLTATRRVFSLPTPTKTPKPGQDQNPNPTQPPPTREPPPTEPPPPTREPPPTEPPP